LSGDNDEAGLSRRQWLRRSVAAAVAGAAEGHVLAAAAAASGPASTASSAPSASSAAGAESAGFVPGKYRPQQNRLFQAVPAATLPPRLPGSEGLPREGPGPTHEYVDRGVGWPWDRAGGDWIDADSVRHGSRAWFGVSTNAAAGPTAEAAYAMDVTRALQFVQRHGRWNAFLLRSSGAPRVIAGLHQQQYPPPQIAVTYQSGATGTLRCTLIGSLSPGSEIPGTTWPKYALPVVIEFERPAEPVKTARLSLTVVEHWSGSGTDLDGFIIDPPLNAAPVLTGTAATAGRLDADLKQNPATIGVHRYLDGAPWSDFASTGRSPLIYNLGAERNFDPALFGRGPSDKSKFPHLDLGKWIATAKNWSRVDSGYRGEAFEPLAPGLGAVRVHMPAEPGVKDGSSIDYGGSLAANAFIFLPEPDFGRLKRLFVRYYLRLAPYKPTAALRYQVKQGGVPAWTDMAGKTGITPSHVTSYGGVSGSSGGGFGWQMRLGWADCDAEQGGPDEGGIAVSVHTYDFLTNNPVRHGSTDRPRDVALGQQGGLGGIFYHAQWYCVEMEVDLNSVMAEAPGYLADGAVRMWVDGRLVLERGGMVMRSLPLQRFAYADERLRPCRELGHRDLWFNWFHGGKTANTIDRTVFITGLAWSRAYIGPMQLT